MKKKVDNPKKPFQLYRKKKRRYEVTLTKQGNQIWVCGECGHLYTKFMDNDPRKQAEECCKQQYCECGNKIDAGYVGPKCSPCNSSIRDAARIAKAEEVEYLDGPVYCDSRDRYWSDLDEFTDWLARELDDEEDPSIPEWLHPCNTRSFHKLDAQSFLENELDDYFEDAIDHVVDFDGLQKFFDEWSDKQTLSCWEADFKKKINVQKLVDQIRAEQKRDTTAQQAASSEEK